VRAVIQRVNYAQVSVSGTVIGKIQEGYVVLLGVTHEDTREDAFYLADKISKLRIFEDIHGKMNQSIQDVKGSILVVSQFTLYGACKKGNPPSFSKAAIPKQAEILYEYFINQLSKRNILVQSGRFGADMQVTLCNNGPVTIWMDSKQME